MYSPTCYQTQTSLVESSCTASQRKPYKDHSASYSLFRCFSASCLLIVHFIIYAIRCSSGSRGTRGPWLPWICKNKSSKDCCRRWPHRFHVSCPPSPGRWIRYWDVLNLIVSSFHFFLFELFVQCDLINIAKSIVARNHN